MELTRKILIYFAVIGTLLVAIALRSWVRDGRQTSFKKELWGSLIAIFMFAIIGAIIVYINN
jgi:heme A synthase